MSVRRDGPLKVSGSARYVAEIDAPRLAHAVLVESAIARGRILSISIARALHSPGVIEILTHENAQRLAPARVLLDPGDDGQLNANGAGTAHLPLQSPEIHYSGQHVALVVAESLEQATRAAECLDIQYQPQTPVASLEANLARAFSPGKEWDHPAAVSRGDFASEFAHADVRIDRVYRTAFQHHTTMEPHATMAHWDGGKLTVYEPSTWVYGVRKTLAAWFGMPEEDIRAVQYFVGGSFGCKGPTWPHVALAAIAAKRTGRPVRLVLTRRQTFTSVGYRPRINHHIQLGARRDGSLTSLAHHAVATTSLMDRRVVAPVTKTTRKLYPAPNCETSYRLVDLNLPGPFTFRGPGETPGLFALECAMDELASALRIDPLELRLRNDTQRDPETGKPWSSRSLAECCRQGAARFGWNRRHPEPRSMRDGHRLIGMGMASMAYDAKMVPASARAVLRSDGSVLVQSATCDQGTGSYTSLPALAAEILGIPAARIQIELGDTHLPLAPISAGSQTIASVGSAIQAACRQLLVNTANLTKPGDAFAQVKPPETREEFVCYSFGAHFAEVSVDADLGEVRVTRYTCAFGAGRIIDPQLAHSQLLGGVVWGIGMALHESTVLDPAQGRFVNTNLSEYHVPVNADIPFIDAFFVEEHDSRVNPLGAKGVGEIGTIGAAAAIANAVFHATGKRVRDLPITPDKLL